MSNVSSAANTRQDPYGASNDAARPPPSRADDSFRPPKPPGETPSSAEVLAKVAQRSQSLPPAEDSLALSAAAARYSLTSMDSAKQIAREIRASVEKQPAEEVTQAASSQRHAEIADALLG